MMENSCILQIEDDQDDIFFLQHAFRGAGVACPLRTAQDGQEAINYLSGDGKFAERSEFPIPHLVLLDLKLPRKNGFEVLQWIRENPVLSWLPVIVFTSSNQPSDISQAYHLGANSYVVKPSSVEQRAEFARLLKDYWLQYNLLPPKPSELGLS